MPVLKDASVLVTGGAGFIGSHLVERLVELGARVTVLDNLATGRIQNLTPWRDRIELIEGDIRDADACRRACSGRSVVFHQAALGSVPRSMADPATTIDVNVTGTATVLAAARDAGVDRVVYASSSSVYGDTQAMPMREGVEGRPLSPYALSKVVNEETGEVFCRCFGLAVVGLRYFNVFGPRQRPDGPYAAVVPRFCAAYLAGEPPEIYGDGEQSRDFTYVADAVQANLLAASAPEDAWGRAFNVAAGYSTSVNELARQIRSAAGGGPDPAHVSPRPGDVPRSMADPTAARQVLGFRVAHAVDSSLAATFDWYRASRNRSAADR